MSKSFSQITFDFAPREPQPFTDSIAEENKVPATAETCPTEEVITEEPVVLFNPVAKPSGRGRKSQKTFAAEADLVNIPEDDVLFQKQYYAIGEVSQMFKVNASLLRFWESEFDIIKPRKNRKGDRHFRPIDIKNLKLIYDLLRRRKLTIEGAKDFLKHNKKSQERFDMIQSLQKIRSFLLEMKASL
ncbi:MAG: MerR family transcriptional regulator [Chitinophagaceae bacterium]|nr:MerR family transcriptional regulator [Chitinophagaceae bacterium]